MKNLTSRTRILLFAAVALLVVLLITLVLLQKADTVATVNGTRITQKQVNDWVDEAIAQGAADTAQLRQAIIDRLIFRAVALQEVQKLGLLKNKSNAFKVSIASENTEVELWFSAYLKDRHITDADLKALYDQQVVASRDPKNSSQYLISQIVVPSQAEAKQIIDQLRKKEASFNSIAQEKSTDKESAVRGGVIGWLLVSQTAPPIGEAILGLQKGQFSQVPVSTKFGWHIIKVDDIKPVTIASFEQSKGNLVQAAIQQRRQEAIESLLKGAKIDKTK